MTFHPSRPNGRETDRLTSNWGAAATRRELARARKAAREGTVKRIFARIRSVFLSERLGLKVNERLDDPKDREY